MDDTASHEAAMRRQSLETSAASSATAAHALRDAEPDSIRSLQWLGRRAARGEVVTLREIDGVLRSVGRTLDEFTVGRALLALAVRDRLDGAAARRRVFHATRALVEQLSRAGGARRPPRAERRELVVDPDAAAPRL